MATAQEVEHFFQVAKASVLEAGEVIRKGNDEQKQVTEKSCAMDLVTKYDIEIESIIFTNLSKEFPDHKFIMEEASADKEKIPELTDSPTWIIDPIDGTTNFVHSFPQSCISIGLAINKKIEIGIIYNPCYGEMYTAKRGQGAFLNGKPIRTSSVKDLSQALVTLELAFLLDPTIGDIILARSTIFLKTAHGVRAIGSAALSFAYVARGAADIFQVDGLKPWDVAAGFLIVTEAGGTVIDTKGGTFDFMAPRILAASTESLATETSRLIVESDLKAQRRRLLKK